MAGYSRARRRLMRARFGRPVRVSTADFDALAIKAPGVAVLRKKFEGGRLSPASLEAGTRHPAKGRKAS